MFAFAQVLMESNKNLFIDVDNVCTDSLTANRLCPAQDINFFYTGFHLSEVQSCALIFSTNFYFIFIFK